MGKSVLPSPFVAGLRHKIKIKLAGTDGTIYQLLTKARFEEAKTKELGLVRDTPPTTSTKQAIAARTPGRVPLAGQGPQSGRYFQPDTGQRAQRNSNNTCHSCGGGGHYRRQCPFNRPTSKETLGATNKFARITPGKSSR